MSFHATTKLNMNHTVNRNNMGKTLTTMVNTQDAEMCFVLQMFLLATFVFEKCMEFASTTKF